MLKKIMDKLFRKQPEKPPSSPYIEEIDNLKACLELNHEVYRDISRIEVLFHSVELYCEILQRAIISLLEKREFSFVGYVPNLKKIPRNKFYLSKDGNFLNVELWNKQFIERAIELITLYEEHVSNEEQLKSINRIMAIVDNLLSLSYQLKKENQNEEIES